MRHVLIAGAVIAGSGFVATTAANAQVTYQAGGPDRIGNMCQVATDARGEIPTATTRRAAIRLSPAPRAASATRRD